MENRNSEKEFVCLDIGGTAIKYGVITGSGKVLAKYETPSEVHKGGKALAGKAHDLAEKMMAEYPNAEGIAISTAGVVNSDTAEIIHSAPIIPEYIGINYKDELSDLNLPVEAENDVNCAGLAEYESGNAKGSSSALVLTIGTGIGGCFLQEGSLLHGNTYSACEVGYIPIDGVPFQDQAAASSMTKAVSARKEEPESEWDGRHIFAAAKLGDPVCQEEIENLAARIGKGIASICFILNPEVVVLGGGIMAQEEVLRPLIEKSFRENSIPLIAKNTKIEFASHQNAAGMKGALVHFLQKHPELA